MPSTGSGSAVALTVSDLCFAWPDGPTWQGWDQRLGAGLTLVIGGDGVGKTTLLRLFAAELQSTSGQLTLNQHEAWPQPAAYRQHVFWCNPVSDQLDHLSGHAYLQHHRQHHAAWQDEACTHLLDHLELTEHLVKPLLGLSAGMRRKLRLAAALASGAPLTLLDDPFAALDKRSGRQVMELLLDCSEATHRVFVAAMHEQPAELPNVSTIHLP